MHTLGKGSKSGPIQSKTNNNKKQDIKLANWVFPPTVVWTRERDSEAVNGIQEKNDPTRFPKPCAINS